MTGSMAAWHVLTQWASQQPRDQAAALTKGLATNPLNTRAISCKALNKATIRMAGVRQQKALARRLSVPWSLEVRHGTARHGTVRPGTQTHSSA